MPVTEKRKPYRTGESSTGVILPKDWVDFFGINPSKSELEFIIDTPVVIFPPNLDKQMKIDALYKIIKMIELTPEPPKQSK
jgi:hypothetical protein